MANVPFTIVLCFIALTAGHLLASKHSRSSEELGGHLLAISFFGTPIYLGTQGSNWPWWQHVVIASLVALCYFVGIYFHNQRKLEVKK